jgi:hypothetical protein
VSTERQLARRRLSRFMEDAARDLDAVVRLGDEVHDVLEGQDADLPYRAKAAVLAVALHGYYGAAESFAMRVARTFDGGLPDGADWHRQLLDWMIRELPEERPAVFSTAAGELLRRLLAFRHFFRHAYGVTLDLGELEGHGKALLATDRTVRADLQRFLDHVRHMRAALDQGA